MNGNFEQPAVADGRWSKNPSAAYVGNAGVYDLPDATFGALAAAGQVGYVLTIANRWDVESRFDPSNTAVFDPGAGSLSLQLADLIAGASYAVSFNAAMLYASDDDVLRVSTAASGLANQFELTQYESGVGPFTTSSFVARGATDTLTFRSPTMGSGVHTKMLLDNVAITMTAPAVPEPATWAMMLVGFGAIGHAMRRRPALRFAQAA